MRDRILPDSTDRSRHSLDAVPWRPNSGPRVVASVSRAIVAVAGEGVKVTGPPATAANRLRSVACLAC